MRFTYQELKNIKGLIDSWQEEYWDLRKKYGKDYPIDDKLDLILLERIIYKLKDISNISTNLVDFSELQSDIEFIEDYYQIKKFSRVNVWLSNIKSTLSENFSTYMNNIKVQKSY